MSVFERVSKKTIENFITIQTMLLKHISCADFKGVDGPMDSPANSVQFIADKGICAMLDHMRTRLSLGTEGKLDEMRNECFRSWDLFTGSTSYPVPSSLSGVSDRSAERAFDRDHHWKDEQLELRKMLISHSIKFAKAQLKARSGS